MCCWGRGLGAGVLLFGTAVDGGWMNARVDVLIGGVMLGVYDDGSTSYLPGD